MKQLILNPEFGMAGDMLAAAFLSAGAPETEYLKVMRKAAETLGGADIAAQRITRQAQSGHHLSIRLLDPPHSTEATYLREHLVRFMETGGINGEYAAFALRALDALIHAEKEAHGKMDGPHAHHHHCHLHEAQDIIIDISAAAWAAQYFQIDLEKVLCLSPVHTGSGTIRFSHGLQQVPAPATAALIATHNLPAAPGPVETELLTPTGAAILAAFRPQFLPRASFSLPPAATGTGFGTKDFSAETGKTNCFQLYIREPENDG